MLKVYKKQHCNNNNNLGISLSLCLLLTKLLASFRYIPHTILVCEEGEFDRLWSPMNSPANQYWSFEIAWEYIAYTAKIQGVLQMEYSLGLNFCNKFSHIESHEQYGLQTVYVSKLCAFE